MLAGPVSIGMASGITAMLAWLAALALLLNVALRRVRDQLVDWL